jgi:hypothetical protein
MAIAVAITFINITHRSIKLDEGLREAITWIEPSIGHKMATDRILSAAKYLRLPFPN